MSYVLKKPPPGEFGFGVCSFPDPRLNHACGTGYAGVFQRAAQRQWNRRRAREAGLAPDVQQ